MGNISSTCCEINHSHPRVKICIYVIQLHYPMFHAKFQNRRPSGSTEADFFIFILLSLATAAILVMSPELFIYFCSHFVKMFYI